MSRHEELLALRDAYNQAVLDADKAARAREAADEAFLQATRDHEDAAAKAVRAFRVYHALLDGRQ